MSKDSGSILSQLCADGSLPVLTPGSEHSGAWDAAIEAAAALCDAGPGFSAWAGVMAPRKLDRRLAEARAEGLRAAYADLSELIRLLKVNQSLSPQAKLRNLVAISARGAVSGLTARGMLDALPFASQRLIDIEIRLPLGENSFPPRCSYVVTLTERGKAYLAAAGEAQ